MPLPNHILVFRFSALGDVAMTVPVIKNLLARYPKLEITYVTVPFHAPLFSGIDRLHFFGVNKADYKGLTGLSKLCQKLKTGVTFDAIADLHDVLRTKIMRVFLAGRPIAVINKGRGEKKQLTRKDGKNLHQLKSTFTRYAEVFEKLGYPVELDLKTGINHPHATPGLIAAKHPGKKYIGIAPFAKHVAKMYPLEKMKQVVELLQQKHEYELFLFGSRDEGAVLNDWVEDHKNVHLIAGKHNFNEELNLIAQMDAMITMDSANMHLASLYGVPVVSVWGGTHPYLGFYGWGQNMEFAVQEDLPCRPSSVFGNKECPVHGKAGCMQGIVPKMIAEKVVEVLSVP